MLDPPKTDTNWVALEVVKVPVPATVPPIAGGLANKAVIPVPEGAALEIVRPVNKGVAVVLTFWLIVELAPSVRV